MQFSKFINCHFLSRFNFVVFINGEPRSEWRSDRAHNKWEERGKRSIHAPRNLIFRRRATDSCETLPTIDWMRKTAWERWFTWCSATQRLVLLATANHVFPRQYKRTYPLCRRDVHLFRYVCFFVFFFCFGLQRHQLVVAVNFADDRGCCCSLRCERYRCAFKRIERLIL